MFFTSTEDAAGPQPRVPLPYAVTPQNWDVASSRHLQSSKDGDARPQTEAGAEPEDATPDRQ